MGLGPSLCTDRGGQMSGLVRPDVRAFRRCRMSGLGRPDDRAGVVAFVALRFGGGLDFRAGGRMSGASWEAGCPGLGGRMSGPCRFSVAGLLLCWHVSSGRMSGAGVRMSGPWSCLRLLPVVLFIHGLGGLSVFTCIFGRLLLTPDHA